MKKTVEMNAEMVDVLFAQNRCRFTRLNITKLKKEFAVFFDCVGLFEADGDKCFSTKNCFQPDSSGSNDIVDITAWEWDNNEIFLDKSIIGKDYRKAIKYALEIIEVALINCYSGNSFYIFISVQKGEMRNINIRIFLNRGMPYVDYDVEKYKQPVLIEMLET